MDFVLSFPVDMNPALAVPVNCTFLLVQLTLAFFPFSLIAWAIPNLVAFLIVRSDKRRAERGEWRYRELTLFIWAIIGGALGELIGMHVFRHKTLKPKFAVGIPIILIVQIVAFCAMLVAMGNLYPLTQFVGMALPA